VWWTEELLSYNFKISYWKGLENQATNTLSQRPDYVENLAEMILQILRKDKEGNLKPNKGIAMVQKVVIE